MEEGIQCENQTNQAIKHVFSTLPCLHTFLLPYPCPPSLCTPSYLSFLHKFRVGQLKDVFNEQELQYLNVLNNNAQKKGVFYDKCPVHFFRRIPPPPPFHPPSPESQPLLYDYSTMELADILNRIIEKGTKRGEHVSVLTSGYRSVSLHALFSFFPLCSLV